MSFSGISFPSEVISFMAHLEVTLFKIPVDERTVLVKNLTETVGNILNFSTAEREHISVHLNMYRENEMARGGVLIANGHPHVCHLDLFAPVLNFDQKRELSLHLTNAFCDSLQIPPERRDTVFITIHQFSAENVAVGGRLNAELIHV